MGATLFWGVGGSKKGFDPENANAFCSPFDEKEDLETRARIYLDVNCAMCHQPNGPGNAIVDLRFDTPLEKTKMINQKPGQGDLGIDGAQLVAAGDPARSVLLERMKTKSVGRMPNIGSNRVDDEAVKLISKWIESLK